MNKVEGSPGEVGKRIIGTTRIIDAEKLTIRHGAKLDMLCDEARGEIMKLLRFMDMEKIPYHGYFRIRVQFQEVKHE